MITLVDIKKSINAVLKTTGYKVYGNEVKEGFIRPCFFVQFFPIGSNLLNPATTENLIMVEIVFFSKDKTDLENLKMHDLLQTKFTPVLVVGNRKILISKYRSETNDGVLSIKFDLNYFDESIISINENQKEVPMMEELIIRRG